VLELKQASKEKDSAKYTDTGQMYRRAVKIFQNKDPQQAVVDEVIGQLITFLFVPFGLSWRFVFAGFILFRLFDIWKPYPIDSLQNLPAGIGVCADDILAGVYAGTCLALIYAVRISF
jgi:phosphatidylglycerophosphatase A